MVSAVFKPISKLFDRSCATHFARRGIAAIVSLCAITLAGQARAADAVAGGVEMLREKPPVIMLKLDDLMPLKGGIPPMWKDILDYLDSRNIKASAGMICKTIPESKPEYIKWVKDLHNSGKVEFWFHGLDHRQHDAEGKKVSEFLGRSYEEQMQRFEQSQKYAKDVFGFTFQTFGPPDGAFNDDTLKVMQSEPNMKIMLYPRPMDAGGKALGAQGKVVVLDRVWLVGLEASVFVPDFEKFLAGYKKNLTRDYFVLQGHPTHWDEKRHAEFVKIIDFLVSQKVRFVLPREYAEEMAKTRVATAK